MNSRISAKATMAELAERVPGSQLEGDPDHAVARFVHPAEVTAAEDLCLLMDPGAAALLQSNGGGGACALVDRQLAEAPEAKPVLAKLSSYLVVDRPRYALARISSLFSHRPIPRQGIHPSAVIEGGAELAADVSVGAGVWIGAGAKIGAGTAIMANVAICDAAVVGAGCLIYPGVYVGHQVEIGDRVIVHPNACLGGDGFAFDTARENGAEEARRLKGHGEDKPEVMERIESLGGLRIGDDVEIGACATIDRSTLGVTEIGRGTKIDNLVQVGHGNRIGEDVMLCAQVGLAGSSKVGDGAILAGKVGVADHKTIGPNAVLMAKSGVTKDIPGGQVYYGMPARPVRDTLRQYSLVAQLDKLRDRIAKLERALENEGD